MPLPTTHTILALLIFSLCSCGDNFWRKLPAETDIVFEGKTQAPQQTAYRPGQSRDIELDITSSDSEAKFKVVSWSEASGKPGTLDTYSISLGSNMLHYTPQEPGKHELTLKVAVEGEEKNAQLFHCPIEVPASDWKARGSADREGHVTLTIEDVPEEWHSEPWRIINAAFQ